MPLVLSKKRERERERVARIERRDMHFFGAGSYGHGATSTTTNNNGNQQEYFLREQQRQRRPIAYALPKAEFEERHVGGVNALDLSYDDGFFGIRTDSNEDENTTTTTTKKKVLLATAGRDASVRLWDVSARTSKSEDVGDESVQVALFVGHRGWVNDVKHVPSANGRNLVASAGSDKTVRLWSPSGSYSSSINSSVDDDVNASYTGGISDASCALGAMRAHDDYVMSLATNRDGSILASGGLGGQLFAWDVETLKQKWSNNNNNSDRNYNNIDDYSLKGAKASIYCVGIAKDANLIVSGGTELALRVWDVRSKRKVSKLKGHTDIVRSVCINDDGKIAITASSDGTIRVWDISSGRQSDVFAGAHEGGCWSVSGNANFTRFYSGGAKGEICITDIKARKSAILCREMSNSSGKNGVLDLCIDWSANASEAWVCTTGKDVRRWRIDVIPSNNSGRDRQKQQHNNNSNNNSYSNNNQLLSTSISKSDDWFTVGSPAKLLHPSSPASQGFHTNAKAKNSPGHKRFLQQHGNTNSPEKRSPSHATPSGIIPSASAVVRTAELHDRMRILTEDDSGTISVWHVSEGLQKTFPSSGSRRRTFEDVLNDAEINEPCAVPKWFSISHREGSVEISLAPSSFAKAEAYATDLGDSSAGSDAKLNLGFEMVKALLVGIHLDTLDRKKLSGAKKEALQKRKKAKQKEEEAEKQRQKKRVEDDSGTDRDLSSSSSSSSEEYDAQNKGAVGEGGRESMDDAERPNSFRAFKFNNSQPRLRFSSGNAESVPLEFSKFTPLDISKPEMAANVPKWALDCALGLTPAVASAKSSFTVTPCEDSIHDFHDYDVNAIKTKPVNAPRVLTMSKVKKYVGDKLKMDEETLEKLEILSNGRVLKLSMSLATVDTYFWKKGGTIGLQYRFKRRLSSSSV